MDDQTPFHETTAAMVDKIVDDGRQDLIKCMTDAPDDHALELAMSRLRQALGVPGLINTVVKRGYRLGP